MTTSCRINRPSMPPDAPEHVIFPERAAARGKPEARQHGAEIDHRGGKAGTEQSQPRQAPFAVDQEIDQQRIGRDRAQGDPQRGLRPVDRAHEAADRHEPKRRRHAPDQAEQILLRQMRGGGHLAQRQQDLLPVEREHHDRQRNKQRGPQPGSQRTPHLMWIAGAEGLCGQRRHGRHQSHADGEADEVYGARQCRRGDRFVAEPPDEGEVGRHHRDLPKLRQRHRHRQLSVSLSSWVR